MPIEVLNKRHIVLGLLLAFTSAGCDQCSQRNPASVTTGSVVIECDESVVNVFRLIADSFQMNYKDARVTLVPVEGREAIVNFINDSVKVIVSARPLNDEEVGVLKKFEIDYTAYKCAYDAVAVIGHKSNRKQNLRLGEVDSIFTGAIARWDDGVGKLIDPVIGGANSSVNEVFQQKIMKGKPFASYALRLPSDSLVQYVMRTPTAIGIVGLHWLRGREDSVTVFGLGAPNWRPDSTQPYGVYYLPLQAHIYRGYYPVTRSVWIYSRQYGYTVAQGFISYVSHTYGQQKFLNEGLVPATQPIRLVETTSQQVQ